jgi:ferredoxin/flavodoxin---NADP+ reductase
MIRMSTNDQPPFVLLDKYFLSPSTYVLRFSRNGMQFKAGQSISVGLWGNPERREYSIYSAEENDFLEILVKVVEKGKVSTALKKVNLGERLNVHGPGGFFVPPKEEIATKNYLFIATGTGISPFCSIIRSNPRIQYRLLHGIRTIAEAYGKETIPKDHYTTCVSGENSGDFQGRVTEYLKKFELPQDTICYLCGNCEMIYDAYDILKGKGFSANQILTEVYF